MFTGIIESTAKIIKIMDAGIVLARPPMFQDLKVGCSIAVSGVCLSVTAFDDMSMSFDIVPTTFQKTKLGSLSAGDTVNLERAMKADGRFEGHIVTGHSEGTGVVVDVSGSAPIHAHSPGPSPVPGEGSTASHVWKGVSGLTYPPSSVVANAKGMRKKPTKAEEKLWEELRRKKIRGFYFRRQRPIGSCIVDFYCEDLRLAIEVDGDIHDEKNQQAYDQWRAEHLELRGIHVLRFTNNQVMLHINEVISAILQYAEAPLHPEGGGVGGGGMVRGERGTFGEGSGLPAGQAGVGANAASKTNKGDVGGGGKDKHEVWRGANEGVLLTVHIPANLLRYIVPHGSITLDGVALTVADVQDADITIALIPHTLSQTTLGSLKKGDAVNIETDILGKYILKSHGHR